MTRVQIPPEYWVIKESTIAMLLNEKQCMYELKLKDKGNPHPRKKKILLKRRKDKMILD
jgi:hypothetical protein